MHTRDTLRNYLLHTLHISVMPEMILLSDIQAERPFSNHTQTRLILDDVIDEFKYVIQDHYTYLQHPGAKQRLLHAFSFFYNYHISPHATEWVTPLYKRYLERFRHLKTPQKLSLTYLHKKHVVFLGFDAIPPRDETLIKECVAQALSCSIQIPFTSSMYRCMQSLQKHIPVHSVFPPTSEPHKHTVHTANYRNEEEEIDGILDLCRTQQKPITILCPNDAFRRSLIKKAQHHAIDIHTETTHTAQASSIFKLVSYTLALLDTNSSIYSLRTFFSHPLSQSIQYQESISPLRSDILFLLFTHLEKYGKTTWKATIEAMKTDFNHYITHTLIDDVAIFKKELPAFLHAIDILIYIETTLDEARHATSPTQFKDIIYRFLSLFIPHQLQEDPTYTLLTEWLQLETSLTTFTELYDHTMTTPTFNKPRYIHHLLNHITQLTLPTSPSLYDIDAYTWTSLPLRINRTLIIAGFNHTSWRNNTTDNECIPESIRPKFHALTDLHDSDLLFYVYRYCALNPTIITSSEKNNDTYLLPHRFQSSLNATFTLINIKTNPIEKNSQSLPLKPKQNAPLAFQKDASKQSLRTLLSKTTFSSSQFETYQNCPYSYFLTYILGYISPKQVQEGLSSTEWGSLLHTMLYKSYSVLLEKGLPSPSSPQFKEILFSISQHYFNEAAQDSLHWDIKRELCFGTSSSTGILDDIINEEIKQPYTLRPSHLEETLYASVSLSSAHTIRLKGILDCRLESESEVAVLDYKSGKNIPTYADIAALRSLQLSIYMLLLKHHLPQKTVCGAVYFRIHHHHNEKKVMITTADAKKSIFGITRQRPFIIDDTHWENVISRLETIVTLIENGVFTTEPIEELQTMTAKRASVCQYCTYKPYCRYQHRYSSWG